MPTSFQHTNKALIIFKTHEIAKEAWLGMNMRRWHGKTLYISWHEKNSGLRRLNTSNIFIKNIPLYITPREFYEKFSNFGEIMSAKLCEDDDDNSLGYGYISYYDTAAAKKVLEEAGKELIWNVKLLVANFQKKNERLHYESKGQKQCTLYIKNIPEKYKEDDIKNVFKIFGNITWFKFDTDTNMRKFSILAYDNDESARKAIEKMNGFKWDETANVNNNECWFVDYWQKRSERQKLLQIKITDSNNRLNMQFKNCNLHIRNLPEDINESKWNDLFSKYGEIKSVRIPNFILVTKVGASFENMVMSKLFGYVCFTNENSAINAMKEMNGQFWTHFGTMKRPILIDKFMPKNERHQLMNKIKNAMVIRNNTQLLMNPFLQGCFGRSTVRMGINIEMNKNANIRNYNNGKKYYKEKVTNGTRKKENSSNKSNGINISYLNTLETIEDKKDYWGEFIFKNIEKHEISKSKDFTFTLIAKITGMILGIENIDEIVSIAVDHENWTDRINEALVLWDNKNSE